MEIRFQYSVPLLNRRKINEKKIDFVVVFLFHLADLILDHIKNDKLTSFLFTVVTVHVPVKCDADDTASFVGIPAIVGVPASLFLLALSVVYGDKVAIDERETRKNNDFSAFFVLTIDIFLDI